MPSVPYVVVSFGAATKAPGQSAFLNVVDGKEVHTFLMQFTCTVELVTLGTPQGDGMQPLNTAVADLMQLGLFLNSEYAGDFMYDNDIDVSTSGDCLPIVNLRNGVSVPFRAQQTLTVSFRLAKNIAQSKTSNYVDTDKPLTVTKPANWAWHYIGDLALSSKHPEFTTPSIIDSSASSGNGYKSAVYLPPSGGAYEWLSWGALLAGANGGLACAVLHNGLGAANWDIFAGAPGSAANRGEWAG